MYHRAGRMQKQTASDAPAAVIVAVVILFLATCVASGETTEPTTASAPATASLDANAIVEDTLAHYRQLKTYQDTFQYELILIAEDDSPMKGSRKVSGSFASAAPNRVLLKGEEESVYCDGAHVYTHNANLGQYKKFRAMYFRDALYFTESAGEVLNLGMPHPIAALLVRPGESIYDSLQIQDDWEPAKSETRGGESGHVLAGRVSLTYSNRKKDFPLTLWVSENDHLIHEMEIDLTECYAPREPDRSFRFKNQRESVDKGKRQPQEDDPDAKPSQRVKSARVKMRFDQIKMDEAISDDRFTFAPPPEDIEVEQFERTPLEDAEREKLIGRPAPDLSLKGLDGDPISLESMRGKVVLLDFWATWCGPCVDSIPSVQKVADHFKDQPVLVIGVNGDKSGSARRVRKFVEEKKITFKQAMDPDGALAQQFRVRSIPCLVLIDKQGVVQEIHSGYTVQHEIVIRLIERLVKSEPIFSSVVERALIPDSESLIDELASEEYEASLDAQLDRYRVPLDKPVAATEEKPERLAPLKSLGRFQSGPRVNNFDLDGDGHDEFIIYGGHYMGSFRILSSDCSSVQTVRLRGLSGGLDSVLPVQIDGQRHWLVGYHRHAVPWRGDVHRPSIVAAALFSPDGRKLWGYDPDLDEDVGCDMLLKSGDLDGDGRLEFVVGLELTKWESMGDGSASGTGRGTALHVLDSHGNCLSSRSLPVRNQIDFLDIVPSSGPGKSGMIFCRADGKLLRFVWSPDAKPHDAKPPA